MSSQQWCRELTSFNTSSRGRNDKADIHGRWYSAMEKGTKENGYVFSMNKQGMTVEKEKDWDLKTKNSTSFMLGLLFLLGISGKIQSRQLNIQIWSSEEKFWVLA